MQNYVQYKITHTILILTNGPLTAGHTLHGQEFSVSV